MPVLHQEEEKTMLGLGTKVITHFAIRGGSSAKVHLAARGMQGRGQQLGPPFPNVSLLGEATWQETCQQHSAGGWCQRANPSDSLLQPCPPVLTAPREGRQT